MVGTVAECFGRGRPDGAGAFPAATPGTLGNARPLSSCTLITGIDGGSSGKLMVGTAGADTTKVGVGLDGDWSSGRLIVGTFGADTVISGICGTGLEDFLSSYVFIDGTSVNFIEGRSIS